MHRQDITVVFKDGTFLNFEEQTLQEVYYYLMDQEEFDIKHFELANGMQLNFNPYVFHSCYDMGKITEHELICGLQNETRLTTKNKLSYGIA